MHDVDLVLLVLRWVHILAAITAVGGAIFMRVAALPGAEDALNEAERAKLREAITRKWGKVVHGAIALLLITGLANFFRTSLPPALPAIPYHAIFGVKLLLAMGVFFVGTALVGRSPAFAAIRQKSRSWLNLLILMAVVIVLLSGMLNQIRHAHAPRTQPAMEVTPK